MAIIKVILTLGITLALTIQHSICILYPRESETRQVKSLDGTWDFKLSPSHNGNKGFKDKWFSRGLRSDAHSEVISMPVPSSYNDITESKSIRDHIGIVWYERRFFVSSDWRDGRRVVLRFGSICYAAQVWVNGELATSHEIGHLPFETEITQLIQFGSENVVTVAVDNTLLQTTVPQGTVSELRLGNNETTIQQSYTFDFFNYAGIDRPVYLYTTPTLVIEDVSVSTFVSVDHKRAVVQYVVKYGQHSLKKNNSSIECVVTLHDKDDVVVATSSGLSGNLNVTNPNLWWPYLMDPKPGYLYTLKVEISDESDTKDIYRELIGIRSLVWSNDQFLINGKPIYIRGVGKHEDSDIRGKGFDLPTIIKDYNLLKWLGVNAYRTSHYPYAEEIMDFADKEGIMIIDECPSVDTDIFSPTLRDKHKHSLTELIARDKNRPSVIMWSIANEPRTQHAAAEPYFKDVINHVKNLDKTRPITIALSRSYAEDKVAHLLDIVSFNRYNSWYSNTGKTNIITNYVIEEAENWRKKFNKLILMTEYGADTLAGFHNYPEYVWSEEYQTDVFQQHFRAFDVLRNRGFFIGEMIWNFADFATAQTYTRVGGNKKGLLTRQRQPKGAAFLVRKRYFALAYELENATLPKNLYEYASNKLKVIPT